MPESFDRLQNEGRVSISISVTIARPCSADVTPSASSRADPLESRLYRIGDVVSNTEMADVGRVPLRARFHIDVG